MAVSKRLRYEILRRDNHACRYCGQCAPDVKLTVDHVVPVALGGTDDPSNLVAACAGCNAGKSSAAADAAAVADVARDALRWAAAMQQAAENERQAKDALARVRSAFWEHWTTHNHQWAYPPADWQSTIDRFAEAGLSVDDILDCADIAIDAYGVTDRNRYRYFCGVAWKTLERRQEAARALLSSGESTPEPESDHQPYPIACVHKYGSYVASYLSTVCDNPYWAA